MIPPYFYKLISEVKFFLFTAATHLVFLSRAPQNSCSVMMSCQSFRAFVCLFEWNFTTFHPFLSQLVHTRKPLLYCENLKFKTIIFVRRIILIAKEKLYLSNTISDIFIICPSYQFVRNTEIRNWPDNFSGDSLGSWRVSSFYCGGRNWTCTLVELLSFCKLALLTAVRGLWLLVETSTTQCRMLRTK